MPDNHYFKVAGLQVEDDGNPSLGKYFQVTVPNYSSELENMHSFLRIGKNAADVSLEAESKIGKELWGIFSTFYDTGAGPQGQVRARTGPDLNGPRPPEAEFGQSDIPEELFRNAGWRDHCDGNRISTTGGDKVEIIRGNYQQIVLGRWPTYDGAVTNDKSGGIDTTSVIAPGNLTRVEWVQDMGGTWRLTEETVKGDTVSIYHGDQIEAYYGAAQVSLTGGFEPTKPVIKPGVTIAPPEGVPPQLMPDIYEGTLANSIEGHTGSPACPVPTIHEETYASTTSDITVVDSVTSTTTITGSKTETTTAGSITETTTADSITSTTTANTTSRYVGTTDEMYLGTTSSMYLGVKSDMTLAAMFELVAGLKTSILLAGEIQLNMHRGFEATFGDLFDLRQKEDKIATLRTDLTSLRTILSGQIHTVATESATTAATVDFVTGYLGIT